MIIDEDTLLFFDASCLIAAAGSPKGGSGFLLALCARGLLKAAVSQPVLLEAERNIASKLGGVAFSTYQRLVVLTPMRVVPLSAKADRRRYEAIVGEKDSHVVAAALEVGAPFLLTLDKKLAEKVNQTNLGTLAITPGEFIRTVLPRHAEYPKVR